jgi:hypothetical protein
MVIQVMAMARAVRSVLYRRLPVKPVTAVPATMELAPSERPAVAKTATVICLANAVTPAHCPEESVAWARMASVSAVVANQRPKATVKPALTATVAVAARAASGNFPKKVTLNGPRDLAGNLTIPSAVLTEF